jgi:hypothetical protein
VSRLEMPSPISVYFSHHITHGREGKRKGSEAFNPETQSVMARRKHGTQKTGCGSILVCCYEFVAACPWHIPAAAAVG